ncbi:Peptide chain release factor N(5)-glutamine methyltransferase [hydrothermal vent metagenome]|uniref:peptide chain release factor N(5)-glutamine methyltransferase n=1 Tax=hydrothermal vent metagenome TaxID=652676 RepID=A0A3B0SAY2_9ZZZZ
MILSEALKAATAKLAAAGIEGPGRDARILLAHAAGVARDRLTLHLTDQMNDAALARMAGYLARRIAREPVAKIIQSRAFWGRDFKVTADVLDPRPETETLIVEALQGLTPERFLDLGTGSGILAISLLLEWPGAKALATDISKPALAVAAGSAAKYGVQDRLTLQHSDWFEAVEARFDLIVSNPPYIATDEMAGLSDEVRLYDPQVALTDQADGLTAYRAILAGAGGHLNADGRLLVEIGWQQAAAVKGLFERAGFRDVRVLADLEGRDRGIVGMLPLR